MSISHECNEQLWADLATTVGDPLSYHIPECRGLLGDDALLELLNAYPIQPVMMACGMYLISTTLAIPIPFNSPIECAVQHRARVHGATPAGHRFITAHRKEWGAFYVEALANLRGMPAKNRGTH